MAAAAILKNNTSRYLGVWPIGTIFGMMAHIGPPNRTSSWNFELYKSKMVDGRHLEKSKNVVLMDTTNSLLKTVIKQQI